MAWQTSWIRVVELKRGLNDRPQGAGKTWRSKFAQSNLQHVDDCTSRASGPARATVLPATRKCKHAVRYRQLSTMDEDGGDSNNKFKNLSETEIVHITEYGILNKSMSLLNPETKLSDQNLEDNNLMHGEVSVDSCSVLGSLNLATIDIDKLPVISIPDDLLVSNSIEFCGNRCSQIFSSIAAESTRENEAGDKNNIIIEIIEKQSCTSVNKNTVTSENIGGVVILEPISHSTPMKNYSDTAELAVAVTPPSIIEMISEHDSDKTYIPSDSSCENNKSTSHNNIIVDSATNDNNIEYRQQILTTNKNKKRKGRKQKLVQNCDVDMIELDDHSQKSDTATSKNKNKVTQKISNNSHASTVEIAHHPQKLNTVTPENQKIKQRKQKLPNNSNADAVLIDNTPKSFVIETKSDKSGHDSNKTSVIDDSQQSNNNMLMNIQAHDQNFIPVLSSTDNNSTQQDSVSAPVVSKGRKNKGRKRKYPDQTKEIKKKRINNNEDYINSKGLKVKKKIFSGYDFDCKCPKKCTEKISAETREQEFNKFWKSRSYDSRCLVIQNNVEEIEKKRSYASQNSKRAFTRVHKIDNIVVCKKTFLNTIQISQSRINVALQKKKTYITQDLRGSAGGRNKLSSEKRQEVVEFIKKFPRYKSHYCRDQSDVKYLAPHLNLAILYDKYVENCTNPVSRAIFKQIFYNDFNLKFKKPHKDTCLRCDLYSANKEGASGRRLEELEANHKTHLDHAASLRNQMNKDLKSAKTDPDIETLTFDLQKTHCLPCIPTGIAYYKRQLNLYNLGIHCGSTDRGFFHLWLEHEASRGTQEVGSCIRKFILEELKPTTKHLYLWADSCGGQNRSIKMIVMLLHTLLNHNMLETITLRFLQPGHTFLPNDSEFGDVECALKFTERLYTDLDYIKVMQNCRRKRKFVIKRMEKKDFLSVDPLLKSITNRKFDIDKNKISWLNTFEIRLVKEFPDKMYMKKQLNDFSSIVDLSKKRQRAENTPFQDLDLPLLWPEGKDLSTAKVRDLRELLKTIPSDCQEFYKFLDSIKSSDFMDDVDGFGSAIDFEIQEE